MVDVERSSSSVFSLTRRDAPHLQLDESRPLEAAPLAHLIDLVRRAGATTRPELVSRSGMSRKAITLRVDRALDLGLIREGDLAPSGGGRQARTIHFNAQAGYVYAALLGASEMTVAVADLNGVVVDSLHEDWSVEAGPEQTMRRVREHLTTLAHRTGVIQPWGIGVGVPGPVDFATGRLVAPPIMQGWDGFSVRSWMRDHYDAPVWVDNDVNLMALGEFALGHGSRPQNMLYLKVGTGVGAGLIAHGRLVRGELGGAGDIGHTYISDSPGIRCRCGKTGCLEAVAGGWALLQEATKRADESPIFATAIAERGHLVLGDIGEAVLKDDPLALDLIDTRAEALGAVAANLVNFMNPGVLIIGGGVLRTGTRFVEAFTRTVRERGTAFVTDHLEIRPASLNHTEGIAGAALLAAENLLTPASLQRWVEDGHPLRRAASVQAYSASYN